MAIKQDKRVLFLTSLLEWRTYKTTIITEKYAIPQKSST